MLTPLMFAARENDLRSAKLLVKAGADLNAQGCDAGCVFRRPRTGEVAAGAWRRSSHHFVATTLMAACGTGFINGYHRLRPPGERLEVVKLLNDPGKKTTW